MFTMLVGIKEQQLEIEKGKKYFYITYNFLFLVFSYICRLQAKK